MRGSPILEALFPEVRAKVLAATFGQPQREWYMTELARFLNTRPSSLQRELEALSKAGILEQRRDGRRVYLKPDAESPVFSDLKHLFQKTAGIIPLLQREFEHLADGVATALIFGSVAKSEEVSESDIDLLVVGSLGLADLVPALRRAERRLGRLINPVVLSIGEFEAKVKSGDGFLANVLHGPVRFVKGNEQDLGMCRPHAKS